jgi:hypothetical protein
MTVPTFVDVVEALRIMAIIERTTGSRLTDLERRMSALDPAPAAADPNAPVECPECGRALWWNDYEYFYECGRDGCLISDIYFSHGTSVVEAAAIVRRMRGAR